MKARLSATLAMGAAAAAFTLPHHNASAQSPRTSTPSLVCSKAVLHFTPRGFAFECQSPRNDANHILVVRDGNFPGRVDHVIDVLKELNSRSTGAGRTRSNTGLEVTYRRADSDAQAVCNAIKPRLAGGGQQACFIAGDVSYR